VPARNNGARISSYNGCYFSPTNIAIIVCSTIGGVIILCIMIVCIRRKCCRKHHIKEEEEIINPQPLQPVVYQSVPTLIQQQPPQVSVQPYVQAFIAAGMQSHIQTIQQPPNFVYYQTVTPSAPNEY